MSVTGGPYIPLRPVACTTSRWSCNRNMELWNALGDGQNWQTWNMHTVPVSWNRRTFNWQPSLLPYDGNLDIVFQSDFRSLSLSVLLRFKSRKYNHLTDLCVRIIIEFQILRCSGSAIYSSPSVFQGQGLVMTAGWLDNPGLRGDAKWQIWQVTPRVLRTSLRKR